MRLVEWARSFYDTQDAALDDPEHALEPAQHTLHIAKRSLGEDHPCSAWSLDTLGRLLRNRDAEAAEAAHLQAFAIREHVQPRNLHDINQSLDVLQHFYESEHRYEEAANAYRHQIELNELYFANDHLRSILFNFATFSVRRGDYATSVALLQRVLKLDRAYDGLNPADGHVHWWLAIAHAGLGEMDQTTDAFEATLRRYEDTEGPYGLTVAAVLLQLAEHLERQGQHERAHALFMRQRRIEESPTCRLAFSEEFVGVSVNNRDPGLWTSACEYAQHVPWELVAEIDP